MNKLRLILQLAFLGVFTPVVLGNFGCVGETGHGLQLADYDKDGRLDFVL